MGNTSSSPSGGTPSQSAQPSTSTSTSGPSTTQPIPTPGAPTSTTTSSTAFHSGLTPPPRSPSPPCPSTPPLLPYGGHLSPQNPHALSLAQAHDYSKTVVTRLIMEARLAPFYRGLEDYEEDFTEEDIGRILSELREKDLEEGVANSVTESLKAERNPTGAMGSVSKKIGIHKSRENRIEEEKAERDKRERRAYMGAVECPICFLNYPSNINTSRCCQQPICSECFVQIKRGEATLTHLESEPACCPFCVETDFGVIYERPNIPSPLSSTSALNQSALSVSPEAGTSGLSQALSMNSEDAELSVGIGMAPKAQETMRRKSVSHTSKEVVTIDEIRPDWEMKLNAVKAAAARKASRRIVMRQVGDRLIPVGFTSARAPGQADFSMSTGGSGGTGADSGGASPSRRDRRRGSGRERDLEELMIMEAMRLSLLDHDDHQRRQLTDSNTTANSQSPPPSATTQTQRAPDKRKFSLTVPGQSSAGSSSRRASDAGAYEPRHQKSGSTASKIFSKITNSGNRSRSGSTASSLRAVSFSPSATHLAGPSRGSPSASPRPTTPSPPIPVSNAPPALPTTPATPSTGRSPPSSLSPTTAAPALISLADHRSVQTPSPGPHSSSTMPAPAPAPIGLPTPIDEVSSSAMPGLPRLSLDMPPMEPSPLGKTGANSATMHNERAPLRRNDTDVSDAPTERPTYARLDSDV